MADSLSHKVKMAGLRIQEIQPILEMLEQRIEVQEGKIFVSNLRMVLDPK
jgi:hypothetical protein